MALPSPRDRDAARAALTRWFAERLPDRYEGAPVQDVHVSEVAGPPFTGFSNETLVFDVSWRRGATEVHEGFVARVEPTSHTVFPSTRFDEQHRVLTALADTGLPVPRVWWQEADPSALGAPFMVMARAAGEAPADNPPYTSQGWLLDAGPEVQAQVWARGLDAMAAVHGLDWRGLGLGWLDEVPEGESRLAARLERWADYLAWASDGRSQPVPEAALAWLRADVPVAQEGPPALCWGDSRIGNQLFRHGGPEGVEVAAILDWEMVHVGDPVQDLAWFVWLDRHFSEGLGAARLPGFASYEATVDHWEQRTGRTAAAFQWHQVLAGLGFAAVMVRLAGLLVAVELFPVDSDFEHTNTAVTFLATELDRLGAR